MAVSKIIFIYIMPDPTEYWERIPDIAWNIMIPTNSAACRYPEAAPYFSSRSFKAIDIIRIKFADRLSPKKKIKIDFNIRWSMNKISIRKTIEKDTL